MVSLKDVDLIELEGFTWKASVKNGKDNVFAATVHATHDAQNNRNRANSKANVKPNQARKPTMYN